MTGHNHYSDCTCGWCVNYGRSRAALADYKQSFRERDARLLLKQHGANSVSGCYVNPNARCPRCREPVFFYANAVGSRVYFDDLGPPWPKHPCTDTPRASVSLATEPVNRPTRRNKGEVKELLSASSTAGLSKFRTFGQRYEGEWTLVVVLAVARRGHENKVEGEFLDSETNEPFRFTCHSEMPLFEVGEFISVNGNRISFVERETLLPVMFTAGTWVTPAPARSAVARSRPVSQPPSRSNQPQLIRKKQKPNSANGSKYDMTKAEMVHFNNKKVELADLFGKLEPVVRTYAREGTRKPRDVAVRLNAQGYKTASGSKWTPRLVYFLLGLMFNDKPAAPTDNEPHGKTRQPGKPRPDATPMAGSGEMSVDEIASRLSRIGRVVISESAE